MLPTADTEGGQVLTHLTPQASVPSNVNSDTDKGFQGDLTRWRTTVCWNHDSSNNHPPLTQNDRPLHLEGADDGASTSSACAPLETGELISPTPTLPTLPGIWSFPVSPPSPSLAEGRHVYREGPSTSQATCQCEECVSRAAGSSGERRTTHLVLERPMEDTRTPSNRVEERSGLTFVPSSSESFSVPRLPSTSSPTDVASRFRPISPRMPSPTQPAQSPRPPPADPASGNPTQLYPAYLFFLGEDKRYIPYKILTYNVRAPAATANHGNTRILATHLTPEQFSAEQEWEEYRCRRLTPIGYGIRCVWYRTCGPFSIPHPPAVAGAEVDDIFMHHDQTLQYSMWVVNRERRWVPARSGSRQPSNPEWRLWMRETGEPAWITKKTYSIYRSQQHADTRRKLRELDGVHR